MCCGTGLTTAHLAPRVIFVRYARVGVRRSARDLKGADFWGKTGCRTEVGVGRKVDLWGESGGVLVRNGTTFQCWSSIRAAPSIRLAGCQCRRRWIPGDNSDVEAGNVVGSCER